MTIDERPRRRRQGAGGPGRGDGGRPRRGQGRGRRDGSGRGGGQGSLSGRTATRALVAVGAYVAQDLRDAEGLTRPMLRRAALRLALSPHEPVRRLGGAYLRMDPPEPDELPPRPEVLEVSGSAAPRALPPSAADPEAALETDDPPR